MSTPLDPLFDSAYPAHKTMGEWALHGPTTNPWVNAVTSAIFWGESHILLKAGNVLVLEYTGDGPLTVEERP